MNHPQESRYINLNKMFACIGRQDLNHFIRVDIMTQTLVLTAAIFNLTFGVQNIEINRPTGYLSVGNLAFQKFEGYDAKSVKLQNYLDSKNSPLLPYVYKFIEVSEKYGFDWRLLPAITGIESNFGKNIPYNSYNPFGWGNGQARFNSFEEAIEVVGKELYERCITKGVDTPAKIGPSYCPPNYRRWIFAVNQFMWEMA